MKKNILLALFSIAILSCQNPKEKETSQDNNKVIIGYDITEGKKTPLFSGDMMTVDIWEKYIKAHNERDIETIKGLNAENDFKVYDPMGGVASGLSYYFGIDTSWLRLLWILFALFSIGTLFPVYLILWIIIPEAKLQQTNSK